MMKTGILLSGAMTLALLATTGVEAQSRGGGGSSATAQGAGAGSTLGDQDRLRGQDRLRDMTGDQDRLRDRDRDTLGDKDRLRDRDRLHVEQVAQDQLSGLSLLTSTERAQFRSEMQQAGSQEERNRIRAEHQATIQERAQELGVDAPFGQSSSSAMRSRYMMTQLMTDQERLEFHQRMRTAQTQEERQQMRNELHEQMRQRAQEMGVDLPDWFGQPGMMNR